MYVRVCAANIVIHHTWTQAADLNLFRTAKLPLREQGVLHGPVRTVPHVQHINQHMAEGHSGQTVVYYRHWQSTLPDRLRM